MATKKQKNNSLTDQIKVNKLEEGHIYMLQIIKDDGYPLFCGVFDSEDALLEQAEKLHKHVEDITSKTVLASISGDKEALNNLDRKYGAGEIVRDFKSIDVIMVPINYNVFPFEIPEDFYDSEELYESDEELNEAFFGAIMKDIKNKTPNEIN